MKDIACSASVLARCVPALALPLFWTGLLLMHLLRSAHKLSSSTEQADEGGMQSLEEMVEHMAPLANGKKQMKRIMWPFQLPTSTVDSPRCCVQKPHVQRRSNIFSVLLLFGPSLFGGGVGARTRVSAEHASCGANNPSFPAFFGCWSLNGVEKTVNLLPQISSVFATKIKSNGSMSHTLVCSSVSMVNCGKGAKKLGKKKKKREISLKIVPDDSGKVPHTNKVQKL